MIQMGTGCIWPIALSQYIDKIVCLKTVDKLSMLFLPFFIFNLFKDTIKW